MAVTLPADQQAALDWVRAHPEGLPVPANTPRDTRYALGRLFRAGYVTRVQDSHRGLTVYHANTYRVEPCPTCGGSMVRTTAGGLICGGECPNA